MTKDAEFSIFDLDKHRLDEEWVNQPKLFFEYAHKLADARADLEQHKAMRDVVYANLDRDIRASPDKYDIAKITETVITSTIKLQTDYMEADRDYRAANHRVDIVEAYVKALDHRKKALENLVSLEARNYFSSPKAPEIARERMNELEKDSAMKQIKVKQRSKK